MKPFSLVVRLSMLAFIGCGGETAPAPSVAERSGVPPSHVGTATDEPSVVDSPFTAETAPETTPEIRPEIKPKTTPNDPPETTSNETPDGDPTQPSKAPPTRQSAEQVPPRATRTLIVTKTPELPEHASGVSSVAFSAGGRLVATAGTDFKVKICDAATGQLKHELTFGDPKTLTFASLAVAFAPKGNLLAVGSSKEIKLYNTQSGKLRGRIADENIPGDDFLTFTPTGERLVAADSGDISVWSVPEGKLLNSIETSGYLADSVALTPDGKYVAMEGPEEAVDLYDLRTGELEHRFSGAQAGTVKCVAINRDGTLLAASDIEDRLVIYDLKTRRERLRAEDHDASAMAFSPDGLLAIGFSSIGLFVVGEKELHRVGYGSVRGATAAGVIAFSPDGTQMIATDQSHQRRGDLFKLEWSLEEKTLIGFDRYKTRVAVSPGMDWLAWSDQKLLRIYSLADGRVIVSHELGALEDVGRALAFSPAGDRLALSFFNLAEAGGEVRLYKVPGFDIEKTCKIESAAFRGMQFTPDGKEILLSGGGRDCLWNVASETLSDNLPGPDHHEAQFAGTDENLVFVKDDKEIQVRRWPDGEQKLSWHVGQKVDHIAISPDAALAAVASNYNKRVTVWDADQGELVAEIEADPKGVKAVSFSSDGKWLLTAGEDKLLKIWSCQDWALRAATPGHAGETNDIMFASKGTTFLTRGSKAYSDQGSVKQWDLAEILESVPTPSAPAKKGEPPPTRGVAYVEPGGGDNEPAAFIDEGRALFYFDDGFVHWYDVGGREARWTLEVGEAEWVEFSPDGRWFAASYGDDYKALADDNAKPGIVKIWEAKTQTLHKTLTLETSSPTRLNFSPDGSTLAVASGDVGIDREGEVSLWEVASGRRSMTIPVEPDRYTHVQFSPDGTLLAFGGFDNHVAVWDMKENKQRYRHQLGVQMDDMQFSPDGRWLSVCGGDFKHGKTYIYDAASGQQHAMLRDFNEEVAAVAFSPQGDLFAAACLNDRGEWGYRFWSFPEGKQLRLLLPESPRWGWGMAQFSPDGELFAANVFGRLKVWRVADLLDTELQRQIDQMEDRRIRVQYEADQLYAKFPYEEATDLGLERLPLVKRPFTLELNNSDGVTDAGLAHLQKQENLAGLVLSGCQGITPASLAHVKALPLRLLDISDTKLATPAGMTIVGEMKTLERLTLDIHDYGDDPPDIAPVANLMNLRELRFGWASFDGSALLHLADLAKLETLVLKYGDFGDDDLKHLERLTKLRVLELDSDENFTGAGLAHLRANTNLQVLRIEGGKITDEGALSAVPAFKHLRSIDLEGTQLTDAGLAAVAELTELEHIELPTDITDAGLAHFACLTRVRDLDLAGRAITDAGLEHLADLDAIQSINLWNIKGITGSGLAALAGAEKLTHLDLRSLPGITADGLRGLAKMTQLTELSLPPQTTDEGLAQLAPLRDLRKLDLNKSQVTDAGLAHLAELTNLESLSLTDVPLTDAAVPHLAALKNLSSLDIENSKITPAGKENLKKSFPAGHLIFILGP